MPVGGGLQDAKSFTRALAARMRENWSRPGAKNPSLVFP
jgi:hypothetical protein